MKEQLLEILECPYCGAGMTLCETARDALEIRVGRLVCNSEELHCFDIRDGIVRFAVGFQHSLVKKEIAYEDSTYHGSPRLRDANLIAQFPDTLAELWPHTAYFGPDFRELIRRIDVKPGAWVLDIGTGPCWSSRLLAECGANVIALDVNDAEFYGLRTADLLFASHDIYFERILESMACLPFRKESIDRITFNASLHHTPNLGQTLSECRRVLKPDGIVAMVNEEFGSLRQLLFRNESVTDEGSHHRIAYSEFEKAVYEAGFEPRYFVAEHVRVRMAASLGGGGGNLAVKALESFPLGLKQLNSALILLTPTHESSKSTSR